MEQSAQQHPPGARHLLDVSEDDQPGDPTSPEEALYRWLTYVLGEAIDALERSL